MHYPVHPSGSRGVAAMICDGQCVEGEARHLLPQSKSNETQAYDICAPKLRHVYDAVNLQVWGSGQKWTVRTDSFSVTQICTDLQDICRMLR